MRFHLGARRHPTVCFHTTHSRQVSGKVKTDEEYESVKGGWKAGACIPYSAARVEAWAAEQLTEATAAWVAGDLAPRVSFLPGFKDSAGGDVEGQVSRPAPLE